MQPIVLIVEDECMIAIGLAFAAEDAGAFVVGPVATVAAALELLETIKIDAAILDANLLDRDITPVALRLIDDAVPFVIHSAIGLPADLAAVFPDIPQITKPARPKTVVRRLLPGRYNAVSTDVLPQTPIIKELPASKP